MQESNLSVVLQELLSSDNSRRREAQAVIANLSAREDSYGIYCLTQAMGSPKCQVAEMSAFLLKQKYLDGRDQSSLPDISQLQLILSTARDQMSNPHHSFTFLKRCCEIFVRVYTRLGQNTQLITLIHSLATKDSLNCKLALMYLIEISCEYSFDDALLMQHSQALEAIFETGLNDVDVAVKVATFKALTIFLSSIKEERLVVKFTAVLQVLLDKSFQLITYDQESGMVALQSFSQLIQTHPKFVQPIVPSILIIFTEIMEAQQLLSSLRITALYGVFLLTRFHTKIILSSGYFKTKLVPVYVKLLTQHEAVSVEEWASELKDENISKKDVSINTQQHLSLIVKELDNKFLFPLFQPFIQQGLSSVDASYQHAALVSLSILVENCHESYKALLPNLMQLMKPIFPTTDVRIIYDLLITVGYMSEQFAPTMQTQYGVFLLQFIYKAMQHPLDKVQLKAVQCLHNFIKPLQETAQIHILDPCVDAIIQIIYTMLQRYLQRLNYFMVEAVLETLQTIAGSVPFANYYNTFMPLLREVLQRVSGATVQQDMIRSKALETMGYVLVSVKDNDSLFLRDSQEIMSSLIAQQSQLEPTDNLHRAMFTVYTNVVECIKEQFIPYADFVFKIAHESAMRPVEIRLIDEGNKKQELNSKHNFMRIPIDRKVDGGLTDVCFNTDSLTQKMEGSNLMVALAQNLGPYYFKYAVESIAFVKSQVSEKAKEIRSNALEVGRYLVRNAPAEQKANVIDALFDSITRELGVNVQYEENEAVCNTMEILAQMQPFMNNSTLMRMPGIAQAVIAMVNALSSKIVKIYNEKGIQNQMSDQMGDEIDQVEEVYEHIETMVKNGKGIPQFQELRKMFPKEYQFEE